MYGFCGFPTVMTREFAISRIERQIQETKDEIANLEIQLPLVIEYEKLMKEYVLELKKDVKQLSVT